MVCAFTPDPQKTPLDPNHEALFAVKLQVLSQYTPFRPIGVAVGQLSLAEGGPDVQGG
jgi:hypothetical protein